MANTSKNQIAVKNLQGLNDILGAERLCYEKLDTYISIAKDAELKTLLSDLKEASKARYGAVYNYLKSHQA
jgi:hypothetical protein